MGEPWIISHEHNDWFKPLFKELDKREIPYRTVNPTQHAFAVGAPKPGFSLFFNRMSPSAYLRNGVQGLFYTLNYLRFLEDRGVRVINGYEAFTYETSKALQLLLLDKLGVNYPKSYVVNHAMEIVPAARNLRFPIVR